MVQTSPRRAIGESVEVILVATRKEGKAHTSAVEKVIDQRVYKLGVYPAAFWR